jgi:hypothetical protein
MRSSGHYSYGDSAGLSPDFPFHGVTANQIAANIGSLELIEGEVDKDAAVIE